MGEIYPLLDFLEFVFLLTALVLADLLAYQLPFSLSYYWSLFAAYIHTIYCFTSNSTILCIFLCRFYIPLLRCYTQSPPGVFILHLLSSFSFYTSYLHCHILLLISYSVLVGWSVLRFLSLYVTLLIVFCYW